MPSPQPYRSRRGVDVQALQWRPDDPEALAAAVGWLMALHYAPEVQDDFTTGDRCIAWRTRHGWQEVEPGGWIVRLAADGSMYGFQADAFAAEFTGVSAGA